MSNDPAYRLVSRFSLWILKRREEKRNETGVAPWTTRSSILSKRIRISRVVLSIFIYFYIFIVISLFLSLLKSNILWIKLAFRYRFRAVKILATKLEFRNLKILYFNFISPLFNFLVRSIQFQNNENNWLISRVYI